MNISTQLINFLIWSLQKKELTIFLVIDFENFVGDDCISIVSGSTNKKKKHPIPCVSISFYFQYFVVV